MRPTHEYGDYAPSTSSPSSRALPMWVFTYPHFSPGGCIRVCVGSRSFKQGGA